MDTEEIRREHKAKKFITAANLAAAIAQLPKGAMIYTNDVDQLAVYLDGEYIGYINFWKGAGEYVEIS